MNSKNINLDLFNKRGIRPLEHPCIITIYYSDSKLCPQFIKTLAKKKRLKKYIDFFQPLPTPLSSGKKIYYCMPIILQYFFLYLKKQEKILRSNSVFKCQTSICLKHGNKLIHLLIRFCFNFYFFLL